jgi:hypothetical protein
MVLSGCATKMAYLNTARTNDEVSNDEVACNAVVDASDFKDPDLKRNKLNQCMKDKGYKVVSEDEAEKVQGFKRLWVKPGADFNAYEAIFIDKVDLGQVKVKNSDIPDTKVTDEDINNLGEEMLKRFSKTLSAAMPVISDREEATGKKVLYVSLKLNNISQTKVGLNAALEVAGYFSPVPLPGGPEGTFSFEGGIFDHSSKEKLMTISDEVKADKNSSFVGTENYSHWQKAYNVMDYWADHLAALLAKERGEKYKSQLGIKVF